MAKNHLEERPDGQIQVGGTVLTHEEACKCGLIARGAASHGGDPSKEDRRSSERFSSGTSATSRRGGDFDIH